MNQESSEIIYALKFPNCWTLPHVTKKKELLVNFILLTYSPNSIVRLFKQLDRYNTNWFICSLIGTDEVVNSKVSSQNSILPFLPRIASLQLPYIYFMLLNNYLFSTDNERSYVLTFQTTITTNCIHTLPQQFNPTS